MNSEEVKAFYRRYIDCLNRRQLDKLNQFVNQKFTYNSRVISLYDYQEMLNQNIIDIPDLYFAIELLIPAENQVASRLIFDCTPVGEFMGIGIFGKKVIFTEHVFYELQKGKINKVWSVIDKDAIRAQVRG